jgi:HlyD family secretion protein
MSGAAGPAGEASEEGARRDVTGTGSLDLDRLEARGRWLRRGALLLVVGAVLAGGVLAWHFWFGGGGEESRQTETVAVSRGTIRATIATSGTAEAADETELRFASVGRVDQILVTLGQEVKSGDPLATLESGDLKDRLATAQANLAVANIRLRQLLKGADEADLLTADQAVASAQAAVSKAQNDLDELQKGASEAELAAAEQTVASAQSTLDAAQAKLTTLVQTPSTAQMASAQSAVASAEAARTKAQRDLDELLQGASDADLATAEGAVASAQSTLDAARAKLAQLQASPSNADLAAAQAAVAVAETNVNTAENLVMSAGAALDSAQAVLRAAGAAYCGTATSAESSLCSGGALSCPLPISQSSIDDLLDDQSDHPEDAGLISTLVQANSAYIAAINAVANAGASLESAQAGLTSAQAKLDSLGDIPTAEDTQAAQAAVTAAEESLTAANARLSELQAAADPAVVQAARDALASAEASLDSAQAHVGELTPALQDVTAAQSAVGAAKESLQAAQARLQELQEGPDAAAVQVAEDGVTSANANLNAALAKRDKLVEGADPDDVDLQAEQVRLAGIAVDQAQRALDEATLKAPYDGTVASIDIQVGDLVSSQLPAITLLTPGALKVHLAVGETDFPSLRVGMVGLMIFDALQNRPFPVVITHIGLGPNVEQGIVTYVVEAALLGIGEGPADRPAPGMNGSAVLVTDQHQNVLVVPNRAIRRRGDEVVVDVMVNGKSEVRAVQTGLSDTDNTEVVSGLEEGDLLVLPATGTAGQATEQETLPGGIR